MQKSVCDKNAVFRRNYSFELHSSVTCEEEKYSVKRRSILNNLCYFKIGESIYVDIIIVSYFIKL